MLLFVYGTLKTNECANDHLVEMGAEFVETAITEPRYKLHAYTWFPMMTAIPAGQPGVEVHGELWDVPETAIPSLDLYEGSGYKRTEITLRKPRQNEPVIAYLFQGNTGRLSECGNCWRGGS